MKFTSIFFIVIVLNCAPIIAWCLESDSRQPIYIESDAAMFDEKKGESIYTGDVKVTQGSMRLHSDRLIIYTVESKNDKVDKIIATGNPVRFKQKPSKGKEDIHGKSLRAEYYAGNATLILLKKAEVWQGKNTYTSERIEYDTKNSIVRAGQKNSSSKRVHVTLHPDQ